MERRERGFFGRLVVFLLMLLAFVGLLAMALSILSPYIPPKRFVWAAYFGLAFWEIFAFNVVVFVLLLLMWSRKVWIAVLALAFSVPGVYKSYAFGSKTEASDSIKVMSYNVHMFDHVNKDLGVEEFYNQLVNMVREQSPDILCCQEFRVKRLGLRHPQVIKKLSESLDMPYVYYNRNTNYEGNVIFSKFPIAKVSEDSGFGRESTYGVMVSVDAGERGKFHLASVHLASYKITDSEIDMLVNTSELRNNLDTIGHSVVRKMNYAYQYRSVQIDTMLQGMPPVEGPVIVCGDFNDTPVSFVCHKMRKAGFSDTFVKAGRGIKPTYAGKLPLLRIDYIWANDQVTPCHFKRIRQKISDHYPVMLEFTLDKSASQPAQRPVGNTIISNENQSNNLEVI